MMTCQAGGSIEDLVDFYKRWPDLRSDAESILEQKTLEPRQRVVLEWMLMVVDRVGPADFQDEQE